MGQPRDCVPPRPGWPIAFEVPEVAFVSGFDVSPRHLLPYPTEPGVLHKVKGPGHRHIIWFKFELRIHGVRRDVMFRKRRAWVSIDNTAVEDLPSDP